MGNIFKNTNNANNAAESKENDDNGKGNGTRSPSLEKQADGMQMVLPNMFCCFVECVSVCIQTNTCLFLRYMGSQIAAKNKELLKEHHVTHIIAIGWNLEKHFESDFKYLLLNRIEDRPSFLILKQFKECFDFIDECFGSNANNKLFVHCHKGLSRSATVIIGYEMYKHKKGFNEVLNESMALFAYRLYAHFENNVVCSTKVRENRSFVMPNIGFQVQLMQFEKTNYSLDIDKDYADFVVIEEIESHAVKIRDKIRSYYEFYSESKYDCIDDKDLFSCTMLTHQVCIIYFADVFSKQCFIFQLFKLKLQNKLNQNDIKILNESVSILRKIQVEFIKDETSIKRFDIMFKIS